MKRIRLSDNTPSERSGPHRRVEAILDEMDINYSSEERFVPYTLDIYLPEWHLAIEIDGPGHSVKRDGVRDKWFLEAHGIPTLRLDAKIWQGKNPIKERIIQFIEEHAETVDSRKDAATVRSS